jgi:hypothetical protein
MGSLDYLLPTVLLALKLLVKLFVDQSPSIAKAVDVVYCVPLDIIFLATSFAAAFTLSSPSHTERGLQYVCGLIVAAIVIAVLWRRSLNFFYLSRYVLSIFIFAVNAGISVGLLHSSIALFSETRQ